MSERVYQIHIRGHLDADWAEWFDGMTLLYHDARDETILQGPLRDQAQLYGILDKLRTLNLTLLAVQVPDAPE